MPLDRASLNGTGPNAECGTRAGRVNRLRGTPGVRRRVFLSSPYSGSGLSWSRHETGWDDEI
jgi:hypothetical protein